MDWQKLIGDLTTAGHKQVAIAAVCGCSQATISDIARGEIKEPRHSIGVALIEMREKAAV